MVELATERQMNYDTILLKMLLTYVISMPHSCISLGSIIGNLVTSFKVLTSD